jgi:hypothetical protein
MDGGKQSIVCGPWSTVKIIKLPHSIPNLTTFLQNNDIRLMSERYFDTHGHKLRSHNFEEAQFVTALGIIRNHD